MGAAAAPASAPLPYGRQGAALSPASGAANDPLYFRRAALSCPAPLPVAPGRGSSSSCRSVPGRRADITPGVSIRPSEGESERTAVWWRRSGGFKRWWTRETQRLSWFSLCPSLPGSGPHCSRRRANLQRGAAQSRRPAGGGAAQAPPRPQEQSPILGCCTNLPAGCSAVVGRGGPGRPGRAHAGRQRPAMASLPFADRELCGFRTWKGGGGKGGEGREAGDAEEMGPEAHWRPREFGSSARLASWARALFCAEGGCCEGRGAQPGSSRSRLLLTGEPVSSRSEGKRATVALLWPWGAPAKVSMEDSGGLRDAAKEGLGGAPVQAAPLTDGRLPEREAALTRAPAGAPLGRAERDVAGARFGESRARGRIVPEQKAGGGKKVLLLLKVISCFGWCRAARRGNICPRGKVGGGEPCCRAPQRAASRLAAGSRLTRSLRLRGVPVLTRCCSWRAPTYPFPLLHRLCLLTRVARVS